MPIKRIFIELSKESFENVYHSDLEIYSVKNCVAWIPVNFTTYNIYIIKLKFWLIDCLRRHIVQFRIVMSVSYDTLREKIQSFWPKKLSHWWN